jgi:hypothetical protein
MQKLVKKLLHSWRPKEIPGFQGYVVTVDGHVYRETSEGWAIVRRYKFRGSLFVKLDGVPVEPWHLMCLAYGGGNPDQYTVTYNDRNPNNLALCNLGFVEKHTQGHYFSTDMVADRDRPKAKTDKPKTKPKPPAATKPRFLAVGFAPRGYCQIPNPNHKNSGSWGQPFFAARVMK